ncbi:hypothetical protein Mal4_49060 [Maioricimonas rarisocia]|uniref:Uncharacterized protein n=1 Tax=Maioricimonas rarisocia TaxID=2528026 RepID=A0A517ZDK7_9PLAN|nr:hypothetical protein Mal4_49060 [Maioricimonas rarisocia]
MDDSGGSRATAPRGASGKRRSAGPKSAPEGRFLPSHYRSVLLSGAIAVFAGCGTESFSIDSR